jgi:hypothetical protein
MKTTGITVTEVSSEFVKKHSCRSYNSKLWEEIINRFDKYGKTKWYHAPAQGGYAYDRFYAQYTIPEGLMLFSEIGYSSSLSGSGFVKVAILNGEINKRYFGENNESIKNTKEGRAWLKDNVCKYGVAISNCI